ncbi:putative sulfate/molybdate transporter [Calditrichota bacterium]
MQNSKFRFDRLELSGSLGDLGTLIPLSVALIIIAGLNVSVVFLTIGLFYIASGIYFRLPIPVQPLKVVAAIAIAYPEKITIAVLMASSILMGVFLLFLAVTGLINKIAGLFSKPIVRGIQLGLGMILILKGISFIRKPELFISGINTIDSIWVIPMNLFVGIIAFFIVLFLLRSKKYPAALIIVAGGVLIGILFGAFPNTDFVIGVMPIEIGFPNSADFMNALILLVIPQIPLTIGNAIIGTKDACESFFGKSELTKRATHKAFSYSMGIANVFIGLLGGIPLCHGAGGLAAHYRFGARTGGSNIMIGVTFLILALLFGKIGIAILSIIPNSILGILLLFAGLELAMLILDVREKQSLFIVLIVAGIGFTTNNMALAFIAGMLVNYIIRWRNIRI